MTANEQIRHVCEGDVIQANENSGDMWCGCLLIVTEVKDGKVMAGTKIPGSGTAYIFLKHDEYDWIGRAALVEAE